jgi:hypothetical protein
LEFQALYLPVGVESPDPDYSSRRSFESWIALLKRGIVGSFHHMSEEHIDRYISEFAFRWDNRKATDGERMVRTVEGIGGKRLVYKDTINKAG